MKDKRCKLNPTVVLEIVELSQSGQPKEEIARRFSISKSTIGFILQGRIWQSVTGLVPKSVKPCVDCGGPNPRSMYRYCIGCREKRRLAKAHNNGLCTECKLRIPEVGKCCQECKDRRKAKRDEYKSEVIQHYGGKCSCSECPETSPAFLTVDHVNGGGSKHIVSGSRAVATRLYKWLVRNNFPLGFQVLCWNCNCGRQFNGGVCPHQATIKETTKTE